MKYKKLQNFHSFDYANDNRVKNQPQLIAKLPSTIQLKLFPSIKNRKL